MHFATVVLALLLGGTAAAQNPPAADAIPDALKDWRGWALRGFEYRQCPFLATQQPASAEAYLCAWPGRLNLAADASGATFAQRWRVDAIGWVPLPGDAERWPQEVIVDGQSVAVILHDAVPSLWLAPGTHEVHGRFIWSFRPQALRVPPLVGLIDLSVDGKPVAPLERNADWLTLGRGVAQAREADAFSLRVFRKLEDGVPALLHTELQLDVSGQAREETFGPALPTGFEPIALDGELTARLDGEGRLHVQVQPGSWTLELLARATSPLSTVAARLPDAPWPTQEIWSYSGTPELRVTSASGETPIDPSQADVPDEWATLPAFALADGGELRIEERSRGLDADGANRLRLSRAAWLDFNGAGFYAKDTISGTMQRGWRLDVAPPYTLERAEANGEGLLVTRGSDPGATGVELRDPAVALAAGVRIAQAGGALPIGGWREAFDEVGMQLHLPAGYRLFAAPGADSAGGSWVSRWSLLDVFLVAIAVLLAWRLLGIAGGVLALGYLVLGYQEQNAPLWPLVFALALGLLWRALPAGRLQACSRVVGRLMFIMLVLVALPFSATQVRFALYPQLESYGQVWTGRADFDGFPMPAQSQAPAPEPIAQEEADASAFRDEPPPPPAPPSSKTMEAGKYGSLNKVEIAGSRGAISQQIQRYADNTVIQAGRGEPGWDYGADYQLHWSGPVLPEQSVRLLIAPPWLTRLLRVVMLVLLIATALRLAQTLFPRGSSGRRPARPAAAALAMLALAAGGARAADLPDATLLAQLRERLLPTADCAPGCANIASAEIRASSDALHVALVINAGARVAVPLPGERAFAPTALRVDGAAQDLAAQQGQTLLITLDRGVHRVELDWRLAAAAAALKFPLPPARVALALDGWQATGTSDGRLLGDTLSLARERRDDDATPTPGATQQFSPFVRIERTLTLDLEWRIDSAIERIAPESGGFSASVPLLAGEQVLSANTRIENGAVLLAFGDDEDEVTWNSRLARSETFTLTAPPLVDRAEVWKVVVSPTWHARFDGVPEAHAEASGDFWTHEFHPLPGEQLVVTVTRPEAISGRSLAVDGVRVEGNAGARALDTTLSLTLRSTQGGEHAIALPAGAELLGVEKGGQPLNLRARDGRLSLPLAPGAQQFAVRVREPVEIGSRTRLPEFDLNTPAANVQLELALPSDRWVLFTFGPAMGPAVLYWGELVVMILVAIGLARLRRTPLKLHQWLLLGVGFSTFSWSALVVVAAWLLALDWRDRWNSAVKPWLFNLAQLGLAVLAAVALLCLIASIPFGLLGHPDMHVTGNGSYAHALRWFADQSAGVLPTAGAISLPLWTYKLAMLAWALWLANAVIGWLRWGLGAWTRGGYWRREPAKSTEPPRAEGTGA